MVRGLHFILIAMGTWKSSGKYDLHVLKIVLIFMWKMLKRVEAGRLTRERHSLSQTTSKWRLVWREIGRKDAKLLSHEPYSAFHLN